MEKLGWDIFFENHFAPFKTQGYHAMRLIRENRAQCLVMDDKMESVGELTGKLRFEAEGRKDFPVVGDWVITTPVAHENKVMIHGILPRKSLFCRKKAGEVTEEQPIAANIDTVFIVTGLDENYNLRRIERYLSLAWDSGAVPVILLNKADLCPEVEEKIFEVQCAAPGVTVCAVSAKNPDQVPELLKNELKPGKTAAFIGSSGVGKSTLINGLLKEARLKTGEISSFHSLGHHTTTFRQIYFLPHGAMVMDTPGMRELQVWGEEDGLEEIFEEISRLAESCRFSDCRHDKEPGCAIKKALEQGILDGKRLENYLKLKKEYEYLSLRKNMSPNAVEKARWKGISQSIKKLKQNQDD